MVYRAEFCNINSKFDESIPHIDINQFTNNHTLCEKVAIYKEDQLSLILNVYTEVDKDGFLFEQCFKEILIGEQKVAILHGRHVHLFDIKTNCTVSLFLNDYAGHLYSVPDVHSTALSNNFLVTSFAYTFFVNIHTGIIWKSPRCAIDGVIINDIRDNIIYGSGEWDPPGGWRDFSLSLRDGSFIASDS
ncbi:hypothetical protein [Xenorhabdus bharatensis]|uniref:hypothetical protein n=1 Tax=Xenorhabdus bharatensis TaxID=3136256 RepID=UPI0030F380F4